jgi:GTP-binding protein HflX
MAKRLPEPTLHPKERAFLIGVDIHSQDHLLNVDDSLKELELLANTAGVVVVGQLTQKLDHPNPKTYIGSGKITEIKALVEETQADIVLFDEELSPRHIRELEDEFGLNIRILDRTALILDIFAQHAATREGALQVELAQYEYRLPRLTRAWTHLARQAGGGGGRAGGVGGVGLRGPGETQLEVDRRDIRRRISHLKAELEKVRIHRYQYRTRRKRSNIPVIALVGYTNAGKSTLLNRLTEANVYVANELFATLDPTTRRVNLPGGHSALITDTVGFIQKLPTMLVAAFRATLEEIAEADLLLHVVDITHPNARSQAISVMQTLREIEADHIPVVTALNKIDLLSVHEQSNISLDGYQSPITTSAVKGTGISNLLELLGNLLFEDEIPIIVRLPQTEKNLIAIFHDQGQIKFEEYHPGYVLIKGSLPGRLVSKYSTYILK